MSQQFVSRYEEGQKVLDLPELGQVCHALGTPLMEFVQIYEAALAVKTKENKGKNIIIFPSKKQVLALVVANVSLRRGL